MADDEPTIYQFQKLSAAPLPGNPIFLKVEEAAKLLRVTKATVYAAVERGQIPAIKLRTGTVRIPYQGLLDLVETSTPTPAHRGAVEQWQSNTRAGPTKTGP